VLVQDRRPIMYFIKKLNGGNLELPYIWQWALCLGKNFRDMTTLPVAHGICDTFRPWIIKALERAR
jgi:hypothetical protein